MSDLQFRFSNYRLRPSVLGTLLMVVCVALFIKFGFWQYNKAEQKQALQAAYDQALTAAPVELPSTLAEPDIWRYRQVKVTGHYVTDFQIFLDNQVEQERVGYHVITPFKVANSARYILVNRGWIAANPDKRILPDIATSQDEQELNGHLWLPSTKFYTLEGVAELGNDAPWQVVWQNLDMVRYRQSVPFEVMSMVIRLNPADAPDGFVRNWPRPDARMTTHIGYAYQWFGFAVAAVLIWLYTAIRRASPEPDAD